MKKIVLLAVLLISAGVATTKAGVAFGISGDNERGNFSGRYVSGSYARPDAHDALHEQLTAEHSRFHDTIDAQHEAWHWELDQRHKALHRELEREAARGVPWWQRRAQHEAFHRAARENHWAWHDTMRRQHVGGHWDISEQHREAHGGSGW